MYSFRSGGKLCRNIRDSRLVLHESSICTVESHFLDPPRERKIGLRNREVQEIGGKITEKYIQGKRKLVHKIGGGGGHSRNRDSTVWNFIVF